MGSRRMGRVALRLSRVMAIVLGTAGCVSSRTAPPIRSIKLDGIEWRASGRVIRVRPDIGWVVLDCALPPAAGEDVALTRNGQIVAHVRATEHRRGAIVAADILEGRPMAGDVIEAQSMKAETQP